ncbi:cryptochrome/photolyase family protein [Labrys okinawensis]|uniref:cryptochrome/photolyase family protein n=1 Tax=Labrys okinawensis TaxID=346911 RepID=UPI0039BD422D
MTKLDSSAPSIVWFRNDLRLSDNPALDAAVKTGAPILCIYIHEKAELNFRVPQGAALWWLHGSLAHLNQSLRKHGGTLYALAGKAAEVIQAIAEETGARGVYWNHRYDPVGQEIDLGIKDALQTRGVQARGFTGLLLHEPSAVLTKAASPFKVFTPYWAEALSQGEPSLPLPVPAKMRFAPLPESLAKRFTYPYGLDPDPQKPDWAVQMRDLWKRSEEGGQERLGTFLEGELQGYADNRDRLDRQATSRMSPFLRFGNISIRQIWHALAGRQHAGTLRAANRDIEKFKSELGWREFSYSLLYHAPSLHRKNIQASFDAMPWRRDEAALEAWQRGRTGYPVVDAAMRELWATGSMHNRARMIVGSFLVKHLLIDWREGEGWFWDTLVDADPANNPANWQWVAGTGADAAPYFRILNPILQGEKFDPDGAYVKRWLPELARLPAGVVHHPWTASAVELRDAGIRLGEDYPRPIVDHDAARKRALATWKSMRDQSVASH